MFVSIHNFVHPYRWVLQSLLGEICGTNSSLLSIGVKSLSNEYSDRTVENLCGNETTEVLLWIPVGNFGNLAELGLSSRYLGKGAGDEDFAEYCSYDVTTKSCTTDNGAVVSVVKEPISRSIMYQPIMSFFFFSSSTGRVNSAAGGEIPRTI